MDNHESSQLQVLANDLYIIHEKIIKTDALIKIVKEKSKRCNKLEKLHKKLLDTHSQLELKHSESELKLNNCLVKHTPLEIELNELRTRFTNAEALHSEYVNTAELKYQNVCKELEDLMKTQIDNSPKNKEKRSKKINRNMTKDELISKLDDLTIELELTKSELESLNLDITEKDKLINKYEYEKQVFNEKIESLNNKLNKKEAFKILNKSSVGVQTDSFNVNEVPSVENNFEIELELTKSELESLNQDITKKDKIINKYEYEKQVLNEKIELLNNQLNKKEAFKILNKTSAPVQTDSSNVNEVPSVGNDFEIELELTKSELESLNQDITKKDKIIKKYEYEQQVLNEKIESLNNKLDKKQVIKIVNKSSVGVQTDSFNVNEVPSVGNDFEIELELTKSELESLNQDITKKDKIIKKYEYEQQVLNEKIESLNNKLDKKQVIKIVNKNTVGVQTDHFYEVPSVENDFVMDVLPAISELDNSLPILSDSICADIVKSEEKELTSSYVQTDDLFMFIKKEQSFKSCAVQTDIIAKTKSFSSFGCQTNIATNCVQLQTDDDLWIEHHQNLRREKLKTCSSQTYYDDIINLEDVLLEMTAIHPILSPLSPMSVDECTKEEEEEDKSHTIAVGSDEIIPTFVDFYSQTDRCKRIDSYAQTEINNFSELASKQSKIHKTNIIADHRQNPTMIDFNCQTDKIQLIESNTQTESQRKVDSTCQTDNINITSNLKTFSSNLLSPNIKMSQRFCETKLKNRLNTPNSKISKKYKTTKNKLLEHLKLSNLDFKQILEKYMSEGNGPTLFVSPKILKSSQLNNIYNPCNKQQNSFINISNKSFYKQCNSKPFNLHECPCFHSCNMPRNYPSCTTLQCNISCNGYSEYPGYCNHSHRIKIKHNSKAVIVSSDSEEELYNMRNYYKNKFRKKYKANRNCKCNEFSNENTYNKLNSLKRETESSDTDTSVNVCKKRKRRRRLSSESDDESDSQNINSYRDKHKRQRFKNPISQIAHEKIFNNNSSVTTEKRIIDDKNKKVDSNNRASQNNTSYHDKLRNPVSKICGENPPSTLTQSGNKSIRTENRIEDEEMPITNENINLIDSNCDNIFNKNLNNVNIQNEDKNTKNLSANKVTENLAEKCKNIVKPTKEKPTKLKRMRKLLNQTPLNYNKPNIQTRSMSKNIQVESNKKQNNSSIFEKQKLDLFGSVSESSSSNSDVDENLNKSFEISKLTESINKNTTNIRTKNNFKSLTVIPKKQDTPNKPPPLNITLESNQFKNCASPLKVSRNLENLNTPTNHVYKRPERRQIIPVGPLSPELDSCEFVQPKIIPLEQISNTSNLISLGENSTNVNLDSNIEREEILQIPSKIIADIIPSSIVSSKPVKEANLLHNINVASKQSKGQSQEKRFATKMISDIATMDWDKNLMSTVVKSLVNQDTLVIAKLIVNEAAIDHAQQLDKSFTPPAPLMAPSQQKLLVLINRLDSEGLPGLKKKVIILTEKRILSEKHLTNISGLTRIYVALCKLQSDIEGVRMFCCNAAYYLGDLFLPIMLIVLTMWGDVLPMASADVPLAITLVQVIQSKTCNLPGYNTATLNRLLSDYYEYKRGEITNDQVMDKLVACFIENPCNSIFTSIIILCKNLPSKWRFDQIKKHFIPLVDKHRVDQSKSKLISITLTLVNRIKDMFISGNDKKYINELNVWLVKLIANNSNNTSNTL